MLVATTVACSAPQSADGQSDYNATIAYFADLAIAADASQQQIDVLNLAKETGEITFDQLTGLFDDAMGCLADAGFTNTAPQPVEVYPHSGVYAFDFLLFPPQGLSDTEEGDLVDTCTQTYYGFADAAYRESPNAVEGRFATFEDPAVIDCLRTQGIEVEEGATGSEISELVFVDIDNHISDGDPYYRGCEPPRYR